MLVPTSARVAASALICATIGWLWRMDTIGLSGLAQGALALGVAALISGCVWWCTQPLRDMSNRVARLNPQNLQERLRPSGRRDETSTLARAIDQLLDRVAAGYESQRQFAANASHELRTPLAVQRALIEISLQKPRTTDQLALLSEQLLETNRRNEQIIEGLLVLAETDRGLAAAVPVKLDEIVAQSVRSYEVMAAASQVKVILKAEPFTVRGEQVLLERLVSNLLQNAIKYNVPGGNVKISIGPKDGLIVRNSGQVLSAADTTSLFEPFRRIDGSRLHHQDGAGLGLAIVRSIVVAHGGTVSATPHDGGGLIVSVQLPPAPH